MFGGTKYVKNKILEKMDAYPDMYTHSGDSKIPIPVVTILVNNKSQPKTSVNEIFWTNDDASIIDKYSIDEPYIGDPKRSPLDTDNFCKRTAEFYSPEVGRYKYNCGLYKKVYYLSFENRYELDTFIQDDANINTDLLDLPEFIEDHPYEFTYNIRILGRNMNYFTTFMSEMIHDKVKSSLIRKVNELMPQIEYNYFIAGISTDYIYITPDTEYVGRMYLHTDFKIQLNVKNEYFFWVIHKLILNLEKLYNSGMYNLKFLYNFAQTYFIGDDYEMFPPREKLFTRNTELSVDTIENYVYMGNTYKRELFAAPNIVIYVQYGASIISIIQLLAELFPDNNAVSHIMIPRFNIRINSNICFSVGGDNHVKYDNLTDYINTNIPEEYKQILDLCGKYKLSRKQCKILNKYSFYLSGHKILYYTGDECVPNSILSYKGIIGNAGSFRSVFEKYELLEYYPDITSIITKIQESTSRSRSRSSKSKSRLSKF
jgi:hypothetical protein